MTQSEGSERLLRFRLAGVPVQVVSRFGLLERVGEPYLEEHADDEPLFTIRASDDDLAFDRAMAPEYSDPCVELCTVHRLIAEKVAPLRRVVFHSCVVEYEGRAFAFTARSGTGKSTHARLWMRYLGDRGGRRFSAGTSRSYTSPSVGNPWSTDARGRARKVGAITGTPRLPASACFARHQLAPSSAWPQPMPRKPS